MASNNTADHETTPIHTLSSQDLPSLETRLSKPISGTLPSEPVSFQPTPNSRPNPHSQNILPPIWVAIGSSSNRFSPASSDTEKPHPPYTRTGPAHASLGIASGRISREETPCTGVTAPLKNLSLPRIIPGPLDLESGSSRQAEKRKANDASLRHRNGKRIAKETKQKIAAQQQTITTLEKKIAAQQQTITALEKKISDQQQTISDQQCKIQIHSDAGKTLMQEIRAIRKQWENLSARR
ncbi:hypothetical protein HFD88_005562 [Aspergillus terreus]|nr:hypothetical protein HFD88_005562 [Aspergillus terreus]